MLNWLTTLFPHQAGFYTWKEIALIRFPQSKKPRKSSKVGRANHPCRAWYHVMRPDRFWKNSRLPHAHAQVSQTFWIYYVINQNSVKSFTIPVRWPRPAPARRTPWPLSSRPLASWLFKSTRRHASLPIALTSRKVSFCCPYSYCDLCKTLFYSHASFMEVPMLGNKCGSCSAVATCSSPPRVVWSTSWSATRSALSSAASCAWMRPIACWTWVSRYQTLHITGLTHFSAPNSPYYRTGFTAS